MLKSRRAHFWIIGAIYAALAILVTGLFALDRGFFWDELWSLNKIAQWGSSVIGQSFDYVPTRIFALAPLYMAWLSGAHAPVLQVMHVLSWLLTGVVIYFLARQLFPNRALLAYLAGALTLTATGDSTVSYAPMVAGLLAIAMYFASVTCLLAWWQGRSRKWLWGAGILLVISSGIADYQIPALLLTPLMLWVLDRFRVTRRLLLAAAYWYGLSAIYILAVVQTLLNPVGPENTTAAHLSIEEVVQRTWRLFSTNFAPWNWESIYHVRPEVRTSQQVIPQFVILGLVIVGTFLFTLGALWVWRHRNEAEKGGELRQDGPYFMRVLAICLVMTLASNVAFAYIPAWFHLYRTNLVSRIWASLAVAIVSYGLGALVFRKPLLALLPAVLFVGFGIQGGLASQNFYLSLWERHQAELRSIVEQVPSLEPDTRLLLYAPPDSPSMATNKLQSGWYWMTYLYNDLTLRSRVVIWSGRDTTSCEPGEHAFICHPALSSAACRSDTSLCPTLPYSRTVWLSYSVPDNRYVLQPSLPPGFGKAAAADEYNPQALISSSKPLPVYAQNLLYGPLYAARLLPSPPPLPYETFLSVDPALSNTVMLDPYVVMPWNTDLTGSGISIWLGQGQSQGIGGTLWSSKPQTVTLAFEIEPGPGRRDAQRTAEFYNVTEAGTQREQQTFASPTTLEFAAKLQPGRNDFRIQMMDEANVPPLPNDPRPLIARLSNVQVQPIESTNLQAGPAQAPLITIDPALTGILGINPKLRIPWPIETFSGMGSQLWLGQGITQGLSSSLWSTEQRRVNLAFEVEPGPGRPDPQRTVELTVKGPAGTQTYHRQLDQATTLNFEADLFPGQNTLNFQVLDEVTVPTQPNGDTRALLMLLHHLTITPASPQAASCTFNLSSGWYGREQNGASWQRWNNGQGSIDITVSAPTDTVLRGEINSIQRPNAVDIRLNGTLVTTLKTDWEEWAFNPFTPLTLTLKAGQNNLDFISHNPPITQTTDLRPLAVIVKDLQLLPEDGQPCLLQQ